MRARSLVAVTALLALLGTACGEDETTPSLHGTPVDPPFTVSATDLVDVDGQRYSLVSDTDKPLTLVFFGYTNCPEICGLVMSNLASAMKRLDDSDREQVDVVFVSTDPARDTAPVLRDYLERFDPSFIGVTGDIEEVIEVGLSVAVGVGEKLPSGGYEVDAHSTQVTAVNAQDQAPVYWSQQTSSAEFADDVHTLLEAAR